MTSPDVHVGQDGWLFLVGGTNRPLRLYRRDPGGWWRLRGWQRVIEARRRRCLAAGIAYLHAVVPEKLSVYDDRAGALRIDADLAPSRRLADRMARSPARASFLDLLSPMRALRNGPDLFHRTDSHWRFEGCDLAYRAICGALRAAPVPDLDQRPSVATELAGDLGHKLDPPRSEPRRTYWFLRDAVRTGDNALARSIWDGTLERPHFVGARTAFANASPTADPRRVVLFGDSNAETLPTRLTGMLAETFAEVHFVWSTSLDWRYVDAVRPDILLAVHAERFLTRVPDDRFDALATP